MSGQNGHGLQCPSMPQDCPTCGEFRKLQSSVSELQYQYLHYIQKLEEKLEAVEARLAKVEACDCQKSCRLPGGLVREDGASWSDDKCQLCSCVVSRRIFFFFTSNHASNHRYHTIMKKKTYNYFRKFDL